MFADNVNLQACKHCDKGTYQDKPKQAMCFNCLPGTFENSIGSDRCQVCAQNTKSEGGGATKCVGCLPGEKSDQGSAKCTKCDAGEAGIGSDGTCDKCQAGQYRSSSMNSTSCEICPIGWSTSTEGAATCNGCELGTYGSTDGVCSSCPPDQYQDTRGQQDCKPCATKGEIPNAQQTACAKPPWTTAADCGNSQYLNNTSTNKNNWTCVGCPSGGACEGETTIDSVPPFFGWWPVPIAQRVNMYEPMFEECFYHPACQGMPNVALEHKYYDATHQDDLAKRPFNRTAFNKYTCNGQAGFRNHSCLCHTCAINYRRAGSDQCAQCPDAAANWGFMFLGFVMVLLGLVFIAGTAIASAGKQELSESVQKILLNYFQVAAMIRIFPLRWPPTIESLFDFQGAFSTVGDHLVNPDCVTTSASAAELFYSKQAFFACLPFLVTVLAFVIWYVYGVVVHEPFFNKRTRSRTEGGATVAQVNQSRIPNGRPLPLPGVALSDTPPPKSTPKDRFVVTVGAILYLMFPTLVGGTFQLFDCRTVGNGRWLHADMEESCDGVRYQIMMVLLGVTQLLFYVCGLPLLMLWFLIRNKDRLHTHVVQSRYGLFFAGYKENRFYWEIVLSLRKIVIVGLGVFGPSLGAVRQSQAALLVLFIFIVLEIIGNPFQEPTVRHKILAKLELSTLMVLFLTMWSGLMIFASAEANDTASVVFLTVVVVLMTVVMIVWLIVGLLRECVYEKRASVAALREKVGILRQTMSRKTMSFRFGRGEVKNEEEKNENENSDEGGTVIEMRKWSMEQNPICEL